MKFRSALRDESEATARKARGGRGCAAFAHKWPWKQTTAAAFATG